MRAGRANLRAGRVNLRLEKLPGGTNGWTDVWMDGRTYGISALCPTGHRPFGAAAQKGNCEDEMKKVKTSRRGGEVLNYLS